MKKRLLTVMLASALAISAFASTQAADTADSEPAESQELGYEFVFVCPIVGLEYWNMCADGIAAADAEFGTHTQIVGTTDASQIMTEMVNCMTTAIATHPDGILTYAGIESMPRLLEEAAAEGVPCVAIDSDCSDTTNRLCYIGTDPYNAGYATGEMMLEATGGEGTVAIMMSTLTAEKELAEIEAFKDAIADSNLEVVTIEESGGDLAGGVVKMEAIAQTYPDLTAVLGTYAYDVQAAAKVKEEYDLDWILIGYDDQEETLNYIRKGVIDGIVVQDPYMMGYLGVKALVEYNQTGAVSEESIDTGTIKVTAENVDNYKENK